MSTSHSKRIVLLIGLLCCLFPAGLAAQIKPGVETEWSRGTLYVDGEKVTRRNAEEYLDPYQTLLYRKGKGKVNAAKTMFYVAGGLFTMGAAMAVDDYFDAQREIRKYGHIWNTHAGLFFFEVCGGTAAVLGLTGWILCESGRDQLTLVEESLKASEGSSQLELSFGVTPSGVGLALRF